MIIRRYQPADARALARIQSRLDLPVSESTAVFQQRLHRLLAAGGQAWVLTMSGQLAGFASISPVPGLDTIADLAGFIDPAHQRQGLGGRLLAHLINDLAGTAFRQLTYCLHAPGTPAESFLRRRRFYKEHEEWIMHLPSLAPFAQPPPRQLHTYPRQQAIAHFCRLYQESFSGTPWNQPYSPTEVDDTLDDPGDILFLLHQASPIGFVWTRAVDDRLGEIEPVGVVKSHQGQGHGRSLLTAGLHHLSAQGLGQAQIGVWRANETAVRLYQSFGFRRQRTLTYLAFDLP